MIYEELQEFFKDFQWIDNIPEDQVARDKICLEADTEDCCRFSTASIQRVHRFHHG